ncbi:efflux RND transporter periplasmic adaptor subunit [Rhodohalobacter sp. SW132]|uniref:efflux RND transporter periplasmic adaptor subunit n=1 Tax=Rhodohalobacter sp. SW132 TaxID=2293433 RepID=UPI000E244A4E|nr:efflux RND transporter periplasmic adaptor subunit [Rhodohalobacter sp. SW132]REL25019.1 efflux RND transporter periplasmic adaptor subunit [Rhodohalobacter sp. SW132]
MGKVTKRVIAITIILLVFGALAYPKVKPLFSSPSGQNGENGMQQQRSADVLRAEAVVMETETIEDRIFSTGTLEANEIVDLTAEISGLVTGVYFEEGREVEQGDLLLKINDSELQAEKSRAQYRLNLAEQREERQTRLLERGGISQDEYDATLNEVNVLRSEIELIGARIDQTELKAPFSGKVGLKYISTGSYISPGTRIATLQEIDPIKIDFSIPERYLARVDVGDKIQFNVQGYDSTFAGEVYAIEPRINTETRTLQVRALSGNSGQLLFPGAFANIELILDEIDDAILIPSIALVPELNAQKVYLSRNGKVEEVRVRTGIRTSNRIQIIEGVSPGDTVLTTGILQARQGMDLELAEVRRGSEQ